MHRSQIFVGPSKPLIVVRTGGTRRSEALRSEPFGSGSAMLALVCSWLRNVPAVLSADILLDEGFATAKQAVQSQNFLGFKPFRNPK